MRHTNNSKSMKKGGTFNAIVYPLEHFINFMNFKHFVFYLEAYLFAIRSDHPVVRNSQENTCLAISCLIKLREGCELKKWIRGTLSTGFQGIPPMLE